GTKTEGLVTGSNKILPDGPYNNKSWGVTAYDEQLWIAPGGMNDYNTPQANQDGYYHFDGVSWIHVKSEEMLNAKDIVHIEVNPSNPSEIFVSSWFEHPSWGAGESTHIGMFRMVNNVMTNHYNSENTALKYRERIAGSTLDDQGTLWVTQSFVSQDGPTVLATKTAAGSWNSISLGGGSNFAGVRPPIVHQGYAWAALPRGGGIKVSDM